MTHDLRPGQGPALVQPVQESGRTLDSVHQMVERLLALAARPRVQRAYDASVGGQTNANGHAQILAFSVPQGFDFQLTRLVLDANGIDPSAPSTLGYVQVCEGPSGTGFGTLGAQAPAGSVRDFEPTATGGQTWPNVSTDGEDSGAIYHGGQAVWINVVGGPTNTQVSVYIRGLLTEQ